MVAKELRKLGHIVNVFTNLPDEGSPDWIASGDVGEDGVRYISYSQYANFIGSTDVDLLIVLRDPRGIATTNHAKKRVLWMHDIATHGGMQVAFDQMGWCFDEVWAVSEWHKNQIHETTGYPLDNIKALRNGIVPIDVLDPPFRMDGRLLYAARPERGLPNLIKPGGIMDHLKDYELQLAMYSNYPPEMREFYDWCAQEINRLPNVTLPKELTQAQMRDALANCRAYIYPTQFEETSCIIARECIATRTPILTTKTGALPETLGKCGIFFEDWLKDVKKIYGGTEGYPTPGDDEWNSLFAEFVRYHLETDYGREAIRVASDAMEQRRKDLYWDGVAEHMVRLSQPKPVSTFSRAWSLVQDGDIVAAKALIQHHLSELSPVEDVNWALKRLNLELLDFYPFLLDENDPRYETLAEYYKRFYDFKGDDLEVNDTGLNNARNLPRYQMIADTLKDLPAGSTVVEYGCGEGHVIVPLAQDFPHLEFIAFDQVSSNIDRLSEYPCGRLDNLQGYWVTTPFEASTYLDVDADAVICVEVIEHCERPWEVLEGVEAMAKPGGKIIITTPFGAWEPETFAKKPEEYEWRNHIWHFDKQAIRTMFGGKPNMRLACIAQGIMAHDGHQIGNHFYTYDADHQPFEPFDAFEKAWDHRSRQTCAAAIIAYNNAETILRMLNSLNRKVQVIQIAHGPSTDNTRDIIDAWADRHPHIYVKVIDVPAIRAPEKFGGEAPEGEEYSFSDARNASVEGRYEIADWVLWIDTDEYLSGDIGQYLRHNCLDGYLIPQHHFTVEPRGNPTQIDRPARLFRASANYKANGFIHEHFEVPKGGPGHCFMLPQVDIGHTGYVNEDVRKGRFARNFPFLRWEHETDPSRKLHPFLWFRDIVHRMRYVQMEGNMDGAVELARYGNEYFIEHRKEMANFGAGLHTALEYLGEIRKLLGIGVPLELHMKFDDREAGLSGLFLDIDELYAIMGDALKDEFKRRSSRYK
jgi:glycosyltransferase involved in cell wall biosynthesis/SAM-dependent methyltransferase